ncbi:lipoprotein NlpI [Roseivivax sp. THAF40]|uniref:tetratricopeptide repeat protein n=1 Tax=unclassified Roseivivax TaxID=2639302 RepID=UPI001268CEFB|nr:MULTISPECIES: tetratricopeptide repeat protein [unclassified Roseivivax]QFS84260.1 lipoprotein NlpI [Roseivivax sp. THAF197b]QFT48088.1 lipoprotein NlpI [Roseivivax sp. THAF40]
MSGSASRWMKAALAAMVLSAPGVAGAQGVSGDYLAARSAAMAGDFAAAAEYFDRTILFDKDRVEFLERAALAHMSLGNIERAAILGERILVQGESSQIAQMAMVAQSAQNENYSAILAAIADDKGPGPLTDGLVRAWSLMGQGDMTSAINAFDAVGEMQGMQPFAIYHKALALASVGDFEGAEALMGSDMGGGVQFTRRAITARVQVLSQLDRNDEALALIDQSFNAEFDPALSAMVDALEAGEALPFTHVRGAKDGIAETFFTIGSALTSDASDDFTLLYARIAAYLNPAHTDATLMAAELLRALGQHDLAGQAYNGVARDDPAFHAAEIGRAEALRATDKVDAAVEVLESLAETHGDLPVVQSTLADFMRRLDRYDDAIAAYTRALDLYGEPATEQWFLYYARGISYERSDRFEQAEADFRAALELNPEQPQVLNYLGYSLVEEQIKLDEALDMIERAVAARPDAGYIVDSLGWVYYRLGRYDEAVGQLERAAELMPIDPVVNDHLGDAYWAVGRELEAEFMWKRALSFVDYENVSEDADPERIRRKLEIGLDAVLAEEGAPPLSVASDAGD